MKKILKRILVLLVALSLVFAFSGCDALDEMRQQQAFVNSDGTILWQGNVYKLLPSRSYMNPDQTNSRTVFATEPDVPVLLASSFAKKTLYTAFDDKLLVNLYGETMFYCIESEYDAMCERIRAPFVPDKVCYQYGFYNEETKQYETRYYTLTQEQLDAIKLVTETVEPTVLTDGMYLHPWYSIYLEECSEDMLFRRDIMEISNRDTTYYIKLYTEFEPVLFTVPAGCNAIFGEIFKAFMDAEFNYKYDQPVDTIV